MSYRKIRNEPCRHCKGTGELKYGQGGLHPGSPDKCFSCDGDGYRVVYEDENGVVRHVTVSDHRAGNIALYFPFPDK